MHHSFHGQLEKGLLRKSHSQKLWKSLLRKSHSQNLIKMPSK